jgi:hypothetical protein
MQHSPGIQESSARSFAMRILKHCRHLMHLSLWEFCKRLTYKNYEHGEQESTNHQTNSEDPTAIISLSLNVLTLGGKKL